jgi:hypothetical protein
MTHDISVAPMVMLTSGTGFVPSVVESARRDFLKKSSSLTHSLQRLINHNQLL